MSSELGYCKKAVAELFCVKNTKTGKDKDGADNAFLHSLTLNFFAAVLFTLVVEVCHRFHGRSFFKKYMSLLPQSPKYSLTGLIVNVSSEKLIQ